MKNKVKKFLFYISQNYSFAVLRPIQEVIISRGDECRWFVEGDDVNLDYFNENEQVISDINQVISYQSDAVFVPGNIVPSFIPGLKIQVFHGLPSSKVKKNGQLYHFIIRGMFDLYCTHGPSSTHRFKELQDKYQYFNVAETGWSKLDPLFKYQVNETLQSDLAEATMKNKATKKSIFFASTFSPSFSKAEVLYPLISNMMKDKSLQWYITLHPKMDSKIVKLYRSLESENVKFIEPTEFPLFFRKSDLMLCDTSSIIYEFLTQKKPVITFQTEKEEACLINVHEINQLEKTILHALNDPKTNESNIAESISLFHPYSDGCSSERVLRAVDEMLEGKNIPPRSKPNNFIRNLKLRKKLGYWRF